jgi:NAD(P)-dependent dehydrogenase (short-subunit alcohol dehydrogenase family)
MNLAGRVILVTGASRGIGREVALSAANKGASVALVARNREALQQLADQIGADRAAFIAADLADAAEVRRAFDAAITRFGRVDVLINNAAITNERDFLETAPEDLARTVDLNLRAAVVLTRLAAADMAGRRQGHIVNVSSLAGVTGIPGEAAYSGTKAALRLFTASLRPELASRGVRLTDVVLGFITTDMLANVESNPRVDRIFRRARRLRLMTDTAPDVVGRAILRAIEDERAVLVIPEYARYLYLPLQGVSRRIVQLLAGG